MTSEDARGFMAIEFFPPSVSVICAAKKIVVDGVVCILLALVFIRDFLDGRSKSSGDELAWHRRKALQHLLLPVLAPIWLQYTGLLFYRQYSMSQSTTSYIPM
ncbi:hypothetical protein C7999DRAFT_29248 [Corynascus novoguineensis]|uniref:Uncharacterized protein n=1 Tax=Corynascus novoguineensis TaxID=1126955 RepID=A0AAN7D015_9PEZI|nr:hypothetical protein C7999DRAFT_29248 [Corynascus novoguineensis]